MTPWIRRAIGLTAVVAAATSLVLPAQAQNRELRYAIGQPPSALPVIGGQAFAKAVAQATEGKLTVKVYAMSLLNMAETSAGLRDGLADIGFVLTPYFPAEYPHTNVISEASMMLRLMGDKVRGKEGLAYIPAMTEFIFTKCPECHEEFAKQNQVYTGHVGGSSYGLICNKPVKSEADMKGKRFRVGAANWARWVTAMGGSPVTMSANEMLEALKQGVVDCIVLSSPEIRNFGLTEVVTDIAMAAPGGIFSTAGSNVNMRVWRSLTNEQRAALLRGASVAAANVPFAYHRVENEVLDQMKKRGARIHETDPALVQKSQVFIEQDMKTIADYFASKHGVKRSAQMLAEFRPILSKWVDLVQTVSTEEQYADLYWREVFSKVDTATYGMK
ncbi:MULTISPECIES: C4-dicarboxylate TRAP transporter substrate-binding protein [Hydrogenophaga]|uniref:C4-dicarboxylate ABC transporter substrate-binding protein n=1 Tax=Hydrogenophaga electricum TaxID=1230953 RepID=A0ABQ6C6S4_9BURK|nr:MULTISPECIES: C4-dicarboxylate TRAP transporter substrate-binding protein [Hydrogenophaga]GLS15382.1 hypothetical protein GCM10007935_28170 [Hydrogenophaga electricum]